LALQRIELECHKRSLHRWISRDEAGSVELAERVTNLLRRLLVRNSDCDYDRAVEWGIGTRLSSRLVGAGVGPSLLRAGAALLAFGGDEDGGTIQLKLLDQPLNGHLGLATGVEGRA
jgi:hypothetical protein